MAKFTGLMHSDIIYIPNPNLPNEALRDRDTRRMVERLLKQAAEKAAALAPVGETGDLQASVGYEIDTKLAEGQIFADVPYAGFVEFGTSLMAAQPYLRPGMDSVVPRSS